MDKKELPPPTCEICGFKQDSFNGMVTYTHCGVFCVRCFGTYEPRLKKLCEDVCKVEIMVIKKEREQS